MVVYYIDKDIVVEFLLVFDCKFCGKQYCFGVIIIDMENWGLYYIGYVSIVGRRMGIVEVGGKVNLVIDYEVDGIIGVVVCQFVYLYGFVGYFLFCQCCIVVDEDGQDLIVIVIV